MDMNINKLFCMFNLSNKRLKILIFFLVKTLYMLKTHVLHVLDSELYTADQSYIAD